MVLAVDHKAALCYLPLTIAERLGYFASEGLDVHVQEFSSPLQSLQAVLSGEAQVLSGPYVNTISIQARVQTLQSFVLQGRAPQIVLGVSLRTLPRYRSLRDLRGKTVGVMSLGSASHRMARMLMLRAGVQPHEVRFLPWPSPEAAVTAFRSGQLDAICHADLAITQLEQGGDLRVVADTRTVRGSAEVFGGPWPSACLCAPAVFLSARPQQAQAMANAMVHGLKWLQTAGPSDINKVVPESYFRGDRALYLAAFSRAREAWSPDGLMPAAGPRTVVSTLALFSDTEALERVDLARTFTNELALLAKAKFRA